jgi:hypothetical protein
MKIAIIHNGEVHEVEDDLEQYDLTKNAAILDLIDSIIRTRATLGVKADGVWKDPNAKTGLVWLEIACCTSGLCTRCHAAGNHGDPAKREWQRWTAEPMPRAKAELLAHNWRNYAPRIIEAESAVQK